MMAQAAASLAQALVEDPSAVAERAADFILKTPEIADAIGKAALAYGKKFAEGDIETRGEILGRISGEVLAIYITGGAAKIIASSPRGAGTILQIESKASKFAKIAGEFGKLKDFSINSLPGIIEHRGVLVKIRDGYNDEVRKIGEVSKALQSSGKSLEEVARECHGLRRSIGEKYKNMTPEPLRADIYQRNIPKYGNELGPTFETLVEKGLKNGDNFDTIYKGIIASSQEPNKGLNNLLKIINEELP